MFGFKETIDRIWLKVFLHEHKKQYIRFYTPDLRQFILRSTTENITSIKAKFQHSRTSATVTISPDDIFKKTVDYVVLLPENANSWMFLLAETFVAL